MKTSRRPFFCTFFILQCLLAFAPVSSVQEESELPSSVSSAGASTNNNNDYNLRQPLHLQPGQEEEEEDMLAEERPRRKLWDFWSVMMLIHPPCPPPDAVHQPHHCRGNNGNGANGGSNGSYNGGSSSSSSSNGSSSNSANAASSSSYNYADGSSGSSSGSSSASAANSANVNQQMSSQEEEGFGGLGWYAIPVGLSLCITSYAVAVGSRRKPPAHNLSGALSRRIVATGAYADHVLPPAAVAPDSRLM
ncbi:MAG: hypothetical protein SGBAC_005550 [Bacillariaceae sp.]